MFSDTMTVAEARLVLASDAVPQLSPEAATALAVFLADHERLTRLAMTAAECRKLQRQYFRDKSGLTECKALEARLDRLIRGDA